MEVSTIEVDLSDEIKDYMYEQMDVMAKCHCDAASYTIFKEALDDKRDVSDGATCLGHALLNAIFIKAIRKGLEDAGYDTKTVFKED